MIRINPKESIQITESIQTTENSEINESNQISLSNYAIALFYDFVPATTTIELGVALFVYCFSIVFTSLNLFSCLYSINFIEIISLFDLGFVLHRILWGSVTFLYIAILLFIYTCMLLDRLLIDLLGVLVKIVNFMVPLTLFFMAFCLLYLYLVMTSILEPANEIMINSAAIFYLYIILILIFYYTNFRQK